MSGFSRTLGPVRCAAGGPALVVFILCLPGPAWAEGGPATCRSCHPAEAEAYAGSVHQRMTCPTCHGGEDAYPAGGDVSAAVPAGAQSRPAFDHGPSFRGKPTRAATPNLCGNCHADVERMNPYGLRTDQLARYWTSRHGKALRERGDEYVAVCTDCHGGHDILSGREPASRTHALNIPDTCARCHADARLMGVYEIPVEVVSEYRDSVHGRALLEKQDTGAPTCVSCHDNHSALPPGFASIGAVCGKCHEHPASQFAQSVHASLDDFQGCVQCHGGGQGSHHHHIERVTAPADVLVERYARLLATTPLPTPEQVTEAVHPEPRRLLSEVLPTCTACHDESQEDQSLPGLAGLLDEIAAAERTYAQTALRIEETGRGVLLVENQRFRFQDAKTHLMELSPVQHTLRPEAVQAKIADLREISAGVNADLDGLLAGLHWRKLALIPAWAFAVVFALLLHAKYRRLRKTHVLAPEGPGTG